MSAKPVTDARRHTIKSVAVTSMHAMVETVQVDKVQATAITGIKTLRISGYSWHAN